MLKIFELRTYTLHVGKLSAAMKIYEDLGWPALKKYKDNIIRYYIGDVGALNQIIHVWQFQDDNSRRKLWKTIYSDKDFIKFASEFRPLVLTQENKLMTAAPWTPYETAQENIMQKNKYNIAVIPGDGIGTEVMPEALKVFQD